MKLGIGIFMIIGGLFIIVIAYLYENYGTVLRTISGAIIFEIGFNRYFLPAITKKETTTDEDKTG
jgi:hypothetical protein